jgi:hypothetical protein
MRVHTAAGLDGMAAPFIKLAQTGEGAEAQHVLHGRLQTWFSDMMVRGGMPQAWQPVRIQPIYKKGDPLNPENYRPIAVTSVLYRLYASMVTLATGHWADGRQLIPQEQFGFQRRRSTLQAAFVLRHAGHARAAALPRGRGKLHCVFVDFAKAYDSVAHGLLWHDLQQRLRMPAGLLTAIQKLYEGAVYELRDGHKRTGQVPCSRGIKQGCPLSPLLFSLYISDLPDTLAAKCPDDGVGLGTQRLRCVMFADDLTLLASDREGAQRMLDALHEYASTKGLTVNVGKTEVLVKGERLAMQRVQRQPYTYGPNAQELKRVPEFKFLGLQQSESHSTAATLEARAAAFAASLQKASRTARRLSLGRHLPTRIKLAGIYAVPTANYGDVVWGTTQLRPDTCLDNPAQVAMLGHLKRAARLPPTTPTWPLLNELGVQPLQRGWWKHTLKVYNRADSEQGRSHSPLMYTALAEDMRCAAATPGSWSGELLTALGTLGGAAAEGVQQAGQEGRTALQQAAAALQPLDVEEVMQMVDAAYHAQQDTSQAAANPRDPDTEHRGIATYGAWFQPTVGRVMEYARGRTSGRACWRVQANLRLRLGAQPTPVTLGARFGVPLGQRTCPACAGRGEGEHLGDVLHTCFQCEHVQEQLTARWGWQGPPGGATDFTQLYSGSLGRAMAYGADIVELMGQGEE